MPGRCKPDDREVIAPVLPAANPGRYLTPDKDPDFDRLQTEAGSSFVLPLQAIAAEHRAGEHLKTGSRHQLVQVPGP